MTKGFRILGILIVSIASLSFGIALAAPIFSVLPGAGELTPWLRALKPESMLEISYSILGGISQFFSHGTVLDFLIGFLLVFACIVVPFLKLLVLWNGILGGNLESNPFGKIISKTALFPVVELFIVGLSMLVIKGFPGGSQMNFETGFWYFLASFIFSLGWAFMKKTAHRH